MTLRILQLDETGYWVSEIANRAGKIIGVYLYHDDIGVHCCELTPSYELNFVGSFFTNCDLDEDEREKLSEEIMEGNAQGQELVTYMHCWRVKAMPEIKDFETDSIGSCIFKYDNADEDERERIESASEWLRSNSGII